MAISAGTMAAISAISALAQAGATGYGAAAQAGATDRDRKYREKMDLLALQERDKDRITGDNRFRENQAMAGRADANQRPMNSIGMLGGLSNLSQGMGRSNSLDVLGFLSGGK